jgi:septum formation protein
MRLILGSKSPRRRELLAGLDIPFDVVDIDADETCPADLRAGDIPLYISRAKARAYAHRLREDEWLITADTIVVVDDEVMGKPVDADDARRMLRKLSHRTHQVITGVCMTTLQRQSCFSVTTDVTFKELTDEEINHYIATYHPFDKAGAYGIQEWIGYIGCTGLKGSYYNVMGLPVQRIYTELQQFTRRHSLQEPRQ